MGAQFQVNSYTSNWQDEPDVLALPDGGFLVTWDSYLNAYDGNYSAYYLAGQRYDASGRRAGTEFFVFAGADESASTGPSITALAGGGYAVSWSYSPDGILGSTNTYAQAFDAGGTARMGPVRVDPTAPQVFDATPTIVGTATGGFMVLQTADRPGTEFDDVAYRAFGRGGAALAPERVLNTRADFLDQGPVEAARLADGSIVAIWNSEATRPRGGGLANGNELRATVFSPGGAVARGDFALSPNVGIAGGDSGYGYDVAAAGRGFVVTHREYGSTLGTEFLFHVVSQTFDAQGRPTSPLRNVHRTEEPVLGTSVATLATGEIVVVWEQQSEVASEVGNDVMGRVLSASGRPLSGVFEVGTEFDRYDEQEEPVVAALAGGGFVVTYTHDNLDGDGDGIAARIFGRGTAGADVLAVDASGRMSGLSGNDRLTGDSRANALLGGGGADVLVGRGGADRLVGGRGATSSREAGGADDFVFDQRPGPASPADVILDFGPGDDIVLENAVLAGLGGAGALRAQAFRVLGQGPVDASDRVLYDRAGGVVFYDPDGSGPLARQALARLLDAPALGLDDFAVA